MSPSKEQINPTIAILTDFGNQDPFVGIMKGVIANLHPTARLIDIGHEIPPGDIRRGAVQLWTAVPYFPGGTIFLTVIDPGVGTSRTPMIMRTKNHLFVGPDNGVFTLVIDEVTRAWELGNPAYQLSNAQGATFHGRDIFAPAAAHASLGVPGDKFGAPMMDLVQFPLPVLESSSAGELRGEVLHADHFGNLLTSLGRFHTQDDKIWLFQPWIGGGVSRQFDLHRYQLQLPDGSTLPWARTFGKIPASQCAAIIGSNGLVEIAANGQSAAKILGLKSGDTLKMIPTGQ